MSLTDEQVRELMEKARDAARVSHDEPESDYCPTCVARQVLALCGEVLRGRGEPVECARCHALNYRVAYYSDRRSL